MVIDCWIHYANGGILGKIISQIVIQRKVKLKTTKMQYGQFRKMNTFKSV